MGTVKRRYSSPRREQQARETRRAILDAALELFTRNGFAETSVRQIAERAHVSEQTVYNAFTDKVGLLHAAGMEYAELSAGREDAAFLEALRGESDPLERIRMVARSSRELWEGGAIELDMLIMNHELGDSRMDDLARTAMQYKCDSNRAVSELLFPDGIRRSDVSLDDIVAFATAFDSGSVVKTLVELGWTMDQWEAWLVQLMTLFLEPEAFGPRKGDPGQSPTVIGAVGHVRARGGKWGCRTDIGSGPQGPPHGATATAPPIRSARGGLQGPAWQGAISEAARRNRDAHLPDIHR